VESERAEGDVVGVVDCRIFWFQQQRWSLLYQRNV